MPQSLAGLTNGIGGAGAATPSTDVKVVPGNNPAKPS